MHASLCSHNDALMDLADYPERVGELLQRLGGVFARLTELMWERLPLFHDGYFDGQYSLWAPGPIARLQEDATAGYSPAFYRTLVQPVDRELLAAMLPHIGLAPPQEARLLWVRDTKTLDEVECGEVYREEARARPDLEVLTGVRPLPIDRVGDLPAIVDGHPDLAPAAAAVTGARAPT